jgi:sulfur carrier protein
MRILVNGRPHEVEAGTLDVLLLELGYAERRVATALDGDFVPVSRRAGQVLRDNSRIEIVSPMQGG